MLVAGKGKRQRQLRAWLQTGAPGLLALDEAAVGRELGSQPAAARVGSVEAVELALELGSIDPAACVGELLTSLRSFPGLFDTDVEQLADLQESISEGSGLGVGEGICEAGAGPDRVTDEEAPGFSQGEGIDAAREGRNACSDQARHQNSENINGDTGDDGGDQGAAQQEGERNGTCDERNRDGGDRCEEDRGFETPCHHERG